ncbi:hypothetical protein HDU76_002711 [Blyttiomyces sp. JEL0837]|nr:hypothetical protein HDU76_002711 [Blyttiomyces sp. JEL0837]
MVRGMKVPEPNGAPPFSDYAIVEFKTWPQAKPPKSVPQALSAPPTKTKKENAFTKLGQRFANITRPSAAKVLDSDHIPRTYVVLDDHQVFTIGDSSQFHSRTSTTTETAPMVFNNVKTLSRQETPKSPLLPTSSRIRFTHPRLLDLDSFALSGSETLQPSIFVDDITNTDQDQGMTDGEPNVEDVYSSNLRERSPFEDS